VLIFEDKSTSDCTRNGNNADLKQRFRNLELNAIVTRVPKEKRKKDSAADRVLTATGSRPSKVS
jgi:hypothetical protein